MTKVAAEDLCELIHRDAVRHSYDDTNVKVNELLYRRIDLADAVDAHLRAEYTNDRAKIKRDVTLRWGMWFSLPTCSARVSRATASG